jgi:hypothetical protein
MSKDSDTGDWILQYLLGGLLSNLGFRNSFYIADLNLFFEVRPIVSVS